MNNKTKKEQKNYRRFRSEFAIASVLITLGGPLGILIGLSLLLYLFFYKPKDMLTMWPSLFLMFICLILFVFILILGLL